MLDTQYLIGGALSLFVSAYVMTRDQRTRALGFLCFFGVTTAAWEFAVLLSRQAPDVNTASLYFLTVILTSHLSMAMYFLTVLNIQEMRSAKANALACAPAAFQMVAIPSVFFECYRFYSGESGWYYSIEQYNLPLIVVSLIFIGYMAGIAGLLLILVLRTSPRVLRIKYIILLAGFVLFQAVGTTFANALVAFRVLSPDFRIGGVLQFLTFLSIWYALTLRGTGILTSLVGTGFPQVYLSFLTEFYEKVGSQLGERYPVFREFLADSGIHERFSGSAGRATTRQIADLDVGGLIRRNLAFFEAHSTEPAVVDCYLRVLDASEKPLGREFRALIRENAGFLRRSDLIYGLSGGVFMEPGVVDDTLAAAPDYEACLRIYKRILLPVVRRPDGAKHLRQRLEENGLARALLVSDYGEISVSGSRDWLLRVPRERHVQYTVDKCNAFLGWFFEELLQNNEYRLEELTKKLSLVLKVNREKAVALGIYPSLLAMLATKIPKAQMHELYRDYLQELVDETTAELKAAQESLVRSQRLAAMGQAAAMVGHDLRNPLQAIVNKLYVAEVKLERYGDEELKALVRTVGEQVEYMNKIVSDLQDYARPLSLKARPVSLRTLFDEVLSSLRIPSDVHVTLDIDDDVDELLMDPALMKRVFNNLITNAVQAMPTGGNLRIAASKEDSSVLIDITDTGIGIARENLEKLFQAFFTTKSKGQGLGLAVCKRLVEAHGGSISVVSAVGQGTTFTIKMPYQVSKEPSERVPMLQPEPPVVSSKHS